MIKELKKYASEFAPLTPYDEQNPPHFELEAPPSFIDQLNEDLEHKFLPENLNPDGWFYLEVPGTGIFHIRKIEYARYFMLKRKEEKE